MASTLAAIVQWCHVAAAILWAGGAALSEIVIRPVLARLPREMERSIGRAMTPAMSWYFALAGTATIVFGLLRGTLFGPLQSWSAFFTPYGVTWCVALLIATSLAVLGALGIGRTASRLYDADVQTETGDGRSHDDKDRRRLAAYGAIQISGFLLILACMVLMSEVFG